MSNWQETCSKQLVRLEKAALLADKLTTLCNKTQTNISPELIKAIDDERPRLERQLERLRANRFEVAVIGLEKAGKSALLNAWLGQEILPSARERCTFTSTEIWSAQTEKDQLISIQYYTSEEIDILQKQRTNALAGNTLNDKERQGIQDDYDDTAKNLSAIYEFTKSKDGFKRDFIDISEISDLLQSAVFKNRAQSLAIKVIQLKTVRLRSDRDIVFHDVPGFNSGVSMHTEQATFRLQNCDAIIYAKEMKNPSITGPEKTMLLVADAEDSGLCVSDKAFVVLTQADAMDDEIDFHDTLAKHKSYWSGVPERRLLPVCARSHLVEFGISSDDTKRRSKSADDKNKIKKLGITDGVNELKNAVNFYIDNERSGVLQKRCDILVGKIKERATQVFQALDPIYDKTLDNNTDEEDLYGEDFGKWWGAEWKKISREFENWYQNTIEIRADTDDIAGEHTKLTELRDAYNEQVKNLFANLESAKPETMKMIYKGDTHLVPVPAHGNKAIRAKLYPEIQNVLQQQLPNQLTGSLKALTDEIVNQAKELLFKIEDVERILLENPAMQEQRIRQGFETLFLRFGRVAVDTFIALPLHDRPRLLQEYEPEIRTLEAFYGGSDKETKGNLTGYLRIGLWIMKEASTMGVVPPIVGEGIKIAEKKWDPFNNKASENSLLTSETYQPQNFEEVVKEINGDLMALQDYLQNSVFNAAGFITYSKQELQRIRERFIDLEESDRRWGEVVRREAKRHNPGVPFKIDNRIQDFRLRREIALELKETKDILMQVN